MFRMGDVPTPCGYVLPMMGMDGAESRMDPERRQELEALELALLGVSSALDRLPAESAWRPALRDAKTVLVASVAPGEPQQQR